jgi:hypothetical protein
MRRCGVATEVEQRVPALGRSDREALVRSSRGMMRAWRIPVRPIPNYIGDSAVAIQALEPSGR